ncbi:uncharacterized protein F4822DRAFT_177042 [Hypoxylon trugodes]|uniref:uncharacterized protein n=1 Tax=Hypoxylon trugodes TaxID=326681 RepID=UPI0021979959|nr:uncharacterized protein F4822DRAFT_177042 [Hypoxylon trugodes]KAI1391187.1 hypothetical protein F4822DRAFT_177042 [Hypoxylon trugodes]
MTHSSKKHEPASKKHTKPRSKPMTDDWADVTDAEERRRIQNRLAQRKFREKAKEQKEKAKRESCNLELANSSYRLPSSDEIAADDGTDLSGLPWGSLSMRHVLARGHETESRRSGGSGGGGDNNTLQDEASPQQQQQHPYYAMSSPYQQQQYQNTAGYGSATNSPQAEDFAFQDVSPYYFDYNQAGGSAYNHHPSQS